MSGWDTVGNAAAIAIAVLASFVFIGNEIRSWFVPSQLSASRVLAIPFWKANDSWPVEIEILENRFRWDGSVWAVEIVAKFNVRAPTAITIYWPRLLSESGQELTNIATNPYVDPTTTFTSHVGRWSVTIPGEIISNKLPDKIRVAVDGSGDKCISAAVDANVEVTESGPFI